MNIPLFAGLGAQDIQAVLAHATTHAYPAAERVLNQGDTPTGLYVVLQGRVKLFRITEAGDEVILVLAGPGECLLASAVFYPHPSTVAMETEEACWMLHIPAHVVREDWVKTPALVRNLLNVHAEHTNRMMYHTSGLAALPALERVAGYLLCVMLEEGRPRTHFELPYPKIDIANHLGLTPETFSRCLKALQEHGVSVKGKEVTLTTQESLCPFCDPVHAHQCGDSTNPRCRMKGV